MTIGIGGWGPRRKPMALVRAILRSRPEGPHDRRLGRRRRRPAAPRRQGPQARLRVRRRSTRSRSSRNFQRARQDGTIPEVVELGRGHVPDRAPRRRPAAAVPADARRARLRRAGQQPDAQDGHQPVRRRRGAGRRTRPRARRRAGAPEPRRPARQRDRTSGPTPTSTTCSAWPPSAAYVSCEQIVDTAGLTVDAPVQRLLLSRMMVDRRRRDAERRALHHLHARLRARREVPEGLRRGGRRHRRGLGGLRGALPGRRRGRLPGAPSRGVPRGGAAT